MTVGAGIPAVVAFLLLKLVAYAGWCALGYLVIAPERPARAWRSLRLGAFRLATGFVLGWVYAAALGLAAPQPTRMGVSVAALVAGIAALRWLEWSVVGVLLERADWSAREVLIGRDRWRALGFRAGGVLVSFATDFATVFAIGALDVIPC